MPHPAVEPPCTVCSTALSLPPDRNPNYRCNTSLLVDYCHDDGTHKYILIDVVKAFREQVLRWFVRHKIPSIDSIILTHEHADAVLGLDDLWVALPSSQRNEKSSYFSHPVHNGQKLQEGDDFARPAQLDWTIIEGDVDKPFVASELEFWPLPVMHGEDYVCLGFLFGRKVRVAYLSDVSRILPTTEHAISKSGAGQGQLDLLILETNRLHGANDYRIPYRSAPKLLTPGCLASTSDGVPITQAGLIFVSHPDGVGPISGQCGILGPYHRQSEGSDDKPVE
ncbi:unnamed protein product [Miscanthus lutarioriparius]|uniref:Metallo-beta-lactamase domain-containing protein n=1 Tax=Miscanthus lutarioriparius TaxID=422564 RepID=A0A811MK33_9POAL|nr:unnamed protein product [Miscanthus lutarioriparius]